MNRTDGIKKLMGYVEEMQKEGINICWPQFQQYDLLDMALISKSYGLIKWLVDNDKINRDKVYNGFITFHFHKGAGYRPDLVLLMILSIQDNPIEFLISILK